MENVFDSLDTAVEFQKRNSYVNLCFYNIETKQYHMVGGVVQQQRFHKDRNFLYIKTDFEN